MCVVAKVEESGGEVLATTLASNEKLSNKISKFIGKHCSEGGVADEYGPFLRNILYYFTCFVV